jgi:hypothetical protein
MLSKNTSPLGIFLPDKKFESPYIRLNLVFLNGKFWPYIRLSFSDFLSGRVRNVNKRGGYRKISSFFILSKIMSFFLENY